MDISVKKSTAFTHSASAYNPVHYAINYNAVQCMVAMAVMQHAIYTEHWIALICPLTGQQVHIIIFGEYIILYIDNGKFSWGAKFRVFEGRVVNVKIKIGINSHAPIFHMQSYWWMWFPGIETRILAAPVPLLSML